MRVNSEALKVGDTIEVWWPPGRDTITKLAPYKGPLVGLLGTKTRLADFALNKVGMTCPEGQVYEVINR